MMWNTIPYTQKPSCYVTVRGQSFPERRRSSFRHIHSSSPANMPKVQRTAYPLLALFLSVCISHHHSSFKFHSQIYLTCLQRHCKYLCTLILTLFVFVLFNKTSKIHQQTFCLQVFVNYQVLRKDLKNMGFFQISGAFHLHFIGVRIKARIMGLWAHVAEWSL